MIDVNLITVSEFKAMMPAMDVSRYDDPTISGMLASASKQATDYLEYTPMAEDIVHEQSNGLITTEADFLIFVKKPPIISISEISMTRGTVSVTLQLADSNGTPRYNIDYTKRNVRYPYEQASLIGTPVMLNFAGLRGSQFLSQISYRGGFEVGTLPQPIKQAVAMITADLLSLQFNMAGATMIRQGGLAMSFGNGSVGFNTEDSRLMALAKKLLGPYRRMG